MRPGGRGSRDTRSSPIPRSKGWKKETCGHIRSARSRVRRAAAERRSFKASGTERRAVRGALGQAAAGTRPSPEPRAGCSSPRAPPAGPAVATLSPCALLVFRARPSRSHCCRSLGSRQQPRVSPAPSTHAPPNPPQGTEACPHTRAQPAVARGTWRGREPRRRPAGPSSSFSGGQAGDAGAGAGRALVSVLGTASKGPLGHVPGSPPLEPASPWPVRAPGF